MSRQKIPFRMHRSGWLIPAVCAFLGIWICGFGWRLGLPAGALMMGSLLFHEAGHMLAATALGVPVREFGLRMGGAYTLRASARCGRDEVLISAAGPLFNLSLIPTPSARPGACWSTRSRSAASAAREPPR